MRMIKLGILYIILATLMFILTSCEFEPIIDEKCIDYTAYSFYQIDKPNSLGGTEDQWVLETPHGTIEVSDKVYEGAMQYEYSEICYERSDAQATTYLYTKKSDSIKPEPEIITETIIKTETIVEIQEVYTHNNYEDFKLFEDGNGYVTVIENIAWIRLRIDEEDLYVRTGGENPTDERIAENFEDGDVLIAIWIWDSNVIADDEIWKAQLLHLRNGMILSTYTSEELWQTTTAPKLEDYIDLFLTELYTEATTYYIEAHTYLYPVQD